MVWQDEFGGGCVVGEHAEVREVESQVFMKDSEKQQ